MESSHLRLLEEASALTPTAQIEAEFAKDQWDARHIPGLHYAPHKGDYYITFTGIPEVFRPLVKDYIKFKIAEGRTASTLRRCTYCLGNFFTFFLQQYPHTCTLHALVKQDIDVFILSLKTEANARRLKDSHQHVQHHVLYVEDFLYYLERAQSPVKPNEPTARIVWSHHYPKKDWSTSQRIQYIPQTIMVGENWTGP